MSTQNRREFGQRTLGAFLTYSLLDSLFAADAWSAELKPLAANFLREVHETSEDLKAKKLTPVQWQKHVEKLLDHVDLPDMLHFIELDKLIKGLELRDKGERSFRAKLPEVEGLPKSLVFGHQLFGLKKGRSVVPHGHENMATAFLVLRGDFHGRHYDRVEDHKDHMIIRPTIDRKFEPGEYSSVSDHKDNVHWFTANSETGFIFNIHVLNVDPQNKKNGRVYVDPEGEKLSDGRIKAAKIKSAVAFKKYG
jgi:hypothetical protein